MRVRRENATQKDISSDWTSGGGTRGYAHHDNLVADNFHIRPSEVLERDDSC